MRIDPRLLPLLLPACATSTPASVPPRTSEPELVVPTPAAAQEPSAAPSPAQLELEKVAQQVQADIEKLRETKFPQPVPVKLASKATLVEYLKKRQAIESSPEHDRFREECAKLLGLIPKDLDLESAMQSFLESQVAGFYDPPTKTFYIMDGFDAELGRLIMSHELVHALDDQLYDLDGTAKRLGNDTDPTQAFWSVCEGSGTVTMTQWMTSHMAGLDPKALMEFQKLSSAGMENLPPYVWKPALAAYTCGMTFLQKAVPKKPRATDKVDPAAPPPPTYLKQLERAFREPPRSCEQVLHPEKYWNADAQDEPRAIEFVTEKLPDGWKVLGEDTLGELALDLLTTPVGERKGIDPDNLFALATLTYTNQAATGWGGDRLLLLGRGEARVLQLVTVWDSEKDANEFDAALQPILDAQATTPERALSVQPGNIVVLRLATQPGGLVELPEASWREKP
jgi:hypothetical protein